VTWGGVIGMALGLAPAPTPLPTPTPTPTPFINKIDLKINHKFIYI